MARPTLLLQLAIIGVSLLLVVAWALHFPFPSPVIKPLLPPKLRWPTEEVESWVEANSFEPEFLRFFARDPERTTPPGDNLVSPADGVVQAEPFRDGITYFVVGLSFWDVHVIRTPVAGTIKSVEQEGYHYLRRPTEAEKREAIFLRGKAAPVQQIVTLETNYGDIKVRLITSYWASRIKVFVHPGQRVAKGERIGRILLGSTSVVEIPGKIRLAVTPSQRVVAGETVIYDGGAFQ